MLHTAAVLPALTPRSHTMSRLLWAVNGLSLELFKQKYPFALVLFYGPGCPHCGEVKPEFLATAKLVQGLDKRIGFATVDCSHSSQLCQDYGVVIFS